MNFKKSELVGLAGWIYNLDFIKVADISWEKENFRSFMSIFFTGVEKLLLK